MMMGRKSTGFSQVCQFCGRELEMKRPYGLRFCIPVPCDCEEAVRQREQEDRLEWEENRNDVLEKAIKSANIPSGYNMYQTYGRGTSIYMYGEQGRGKTERACGALRGFIDSGIVEIDHNRFFATKSARFVSVPEMFMRMKKTFDTYGESELDVLESYAGVGMLCLDDLGKGDMTPWKVERLYTILDIRLRERKPTVITSQYDGNSLVRAIAEKTDLNNAKAIWSRIEGMCKIGEIKGRDWRLEYR